MITLREKCPNMWFFLLRILPEYREIRTRKNSVFGHFSRSAMFLVIAMVEFKRDFCTDCSKLISAVLKIYNPT